MSGVQPSKERDRTVSVVDRAAAYHDQDTFDVRATFRSIYDATRHYKLVVILTTLATLGVLTAYIMIWPPVYTAEASLMMEKDYDAARDGFYGTWNVFRKDDSRTETALIVSSPVLKEVIRREHLTYDDVYHPFTSHLWYLWEKSWVGQRYRALKALIFPRDPNGPSQAEMELARTLKDMKAGIDFAPVGEAYVGLLTVKGPSRKVASMANAVIDVYLEQRDARHIMEARRAVEVLTDEVERARQSLREVETRRSAWIRNAGLLSNDFQKENLEVTKLAQLETEIQKNKSLLAAGEASLKNVEMQLQGEPATKTTSSSFELNGLLQQAKTRRLELQMALIDLVGKYREDSLEVKEVKRQIADIDTLIAGSSEKVEKSTTEQLNTRREELLANRSGLLMQIQGLRASIASSTRQANAAHAHLVEVPALQAELHTYDRELSVAAEKFQTLLLKDAQANVSLITASTTMPSLRVIDRAAVPDKPSWPKTKILYPSGAAVGLLLGIAAAAILSMIDGRVRREALAAGRGSLPLHTSIAVAKQPPTLTLVPPRAAAGGSLSDGRSSS